MKSSILLPARAPNLYTAARLYAALGFSVLPCAGKAPAVKYWKPLQERAATARTIDLWHEAGLLTNLGILCGAVSNNLVVIDLDGEKAIQAYLMRFPELQETYAVTSGSGVGMHLYYYVRDLPPTTRVTRIDAGNIELRADGCYVVAPPSIHPSGKPYTVRYPADILYLQTMQPQVDWIKSLIKNKHDGTLPPAANAGKVRNATAYGAVALRNEAAEVARAGVGERNSRLYRAALKMGSLIADGKIDRASVERELLAAATTLTNDDGETATRKTIASGINQGLESSRERHKHA